MTTTLRLTAETITTPLTFDPIALASRAWLDTVTQDGATVAPHDPYGPTPGTGYAVSRPDAERVIPWRDFTAHAVLAYVTDHADDLQTDGAHLGIWRDGSDVYLDVSILTDDREHALTLGRQWWQLAVFDFSTMSEVRIAA